MVYLSERWQVVDVICPHNHCTRLLPAASGTRVTIATPHGRSKEDPPEYEERLCNSSAFRTGTGGEGAGFICSLILVGLKAAFSCRVLRAARARSCSASVCVASTTADV